MLIIEDNRENLELMRYLLQSFGHTVLAARGGSEGLVLAAREGVDLIICDIQMPDLDGFSVLAGLRSGPMTAHTPCLAVTALAMPADRTRALSAGFDGYISKPIEPETFVSEVEAWLGEARGVAANPAGGG